jgi:hypothetical protein
MDLMRSVMQLNARAAAALARVHAHYAMGSGSWSIPCTAIPATFDRKPRPRWRQVTVS